MTVCLTKIVMSQDVVTDLRQEIREQESAHREQQCEMKIIWELWEDLRTDSMVHHLKKHIIQLERKLAS